jgi:two-component system response regulator AtoC
MDDPTPANVSELVREIRRSRVNVLIVGETSVGKEVLAATIHELSGSSGQYMRVNCAALSESLLESELFGHRRDRSRSRRRTSWAARGNSAPTLVFV